MSVFKFQKALLAAAGLFVASAASAATLTVNGSGQLTGAQGVNVGGSFYDVTFADGSCSGLFGGCDQSSDFTFTDITSANAAAQALLDQVFTDSGAGQFDTMTQLTSGCTSTSECQVYIPRQVSGSTVSGSISWNFSGTGDGVGSFATPTTNDLGQFTNKTFAIFTASAAVPEPSTWALMLLGFGAIGASLRRQRRGALSHA